MGYRSLLDDVVDMWARRKQKNNQTQPFGKSNDYEGSDQVDGS